MTISYPLTIPTSGGGIKRLTLTVQNAVGINRSSFTYQTQVQAFAGQLWQAEVTMAPMTRVGGEAWNAFLLSLKGQYGTFYLYDPAGRTPQGLNVGTPLVNGSHAAQSNTLATKGWTASQTNILVAGDYLQLGNRLHKVLNTANSDGSGNATFDIFPSLRDALSNNASIITTNTKGIFRLTSSTLPLFDLADAKIYGIAFSAIEAI